MELTTDQQNAIAIEKSKVITAVTQATTDVQTIVNAINAVTHWLDTLAYVGVIKALADTIEIEATEPLAPVDDERARQVAIFERAQRDQGLEKVYGLDGVPQWVNWRDVERKKVIDNYAKVIANIPQDEIINPDVSQDVLAELTAYNARLANQRANAKAKYDADFAIADTMERPPY